MSLSDVIRNIAKTVTDKDRLKEKARELPLFVVQTTLSAAGQTLMLVDRVKNSLRGGKDEEKKDDLESRPAAAEKPAAVEEEAKPARKEPVIFAPRPEAAEPNGTAKTKPDPVIFSPAAKTDTKPEAETKPEPETKPKPEPEAKLKTETKPEAKTEAPPKPEDKPAAAPEPASEPTLAHEPAVAQPVTVTEPEPEQAEEKPKAKKAKAAPAKAPETAKLAEAAETVPAAVAEHEPTLGAGELTEPLPGFASLSVASLRARMRGKTGEQIAEYLAYEQATSGRPEVIRMYENRLAKLRAGE
ncbi:hypothetical protein [Nonomuraea harbinensis]|uniref:DUF8129 domain-containing protein n=1 Tax=Nonomuraea harbinensis TaxID=1286938 RepID=A0ABW1BUZ8_9ACTN|nr:hypothetical protein [Nonomuraea harbinensis]